MDDKKDDIEPTYIPYPEDLFYRCPVCGEAVQHCFPSSKHGYRDFVGMVREVRYQYRCLNEACRMAGIYFNPAPPRVLPYKQFSLDVWKWIAREARVFHQKPSEIVFRARKEYGFSISEGTVRNITDEVDVYISGKIDEKTREIIKKQGVILLALDGQDPEKGSAALWMFTDVISNRVLAIDILDSADGEVLHDIVARIEQVFGVPIIGFISDKQNSIVKMHDKYYSDIPHQYCQFHFLRNLWKHVEKRDDHVNKELRKMVNNLYITSVNKSVKVNIDNEGRESVREYFDGIASDLKKIVRRRSKIFERLRGIEAFKNLSRYACNIDQECSKIDQARRDVKILSNTSTKLHKGLEAMHAMNEENRFLFKIFRGIRQVLGDPYPSREPRVDLVDACFKSLWDRAHEKEGIHDASDLRAFQPDFHHSMEKIMLEWFRLYQTHRRGLFTYYEFPVPERTNTKIEAKFSEEKRLLFSQCGRRKVGSQVRKRGEYILKQLHVKESEIESIIHEMLGNLDHESIREGLAELEARIKKETCEWTLAVDGRETIRRLLQKDKPGEGNET